MTNTGLDTRITLNTMCSGLGERVLLFKSRFIDSVSLCAFDCEVLKHLGLFLIRFHYRLHRGSLARALLTRKGVS